MGRAKAAALVGAVVAGLAACGASTTEPVFTQLPEAPTDTTEFVPPLPPVEL